MSSNFAKRRAQAKAEKAAAKQKMTLEQKALQAKPPPMALGTGRSGGGFSEIPITSGVKKPIRRESSLQPKKPIIHRLSDKDAEEWVYSCVADVVYWRTPLVAGLWCSTVFLFFFLNVISDYPVVTLVCYVIMLQIFTSWIIMHIAPNLAEMGVVRPSFDPKYFTLQRRAFTDQDIKNASVGLGVILGRVSDYWYDALTSSDARKLIVSVLFMLTLIVVGKAVPLHVCFLVCFALLFSIPPVYEYYEDEIEDFLYDFHDRFDPIAEVVTDRIQSFMPDYDDNYY